MPPRRPPLARPASLALLVALAPSGACGGGGGAAAPVAPPPADSAWVPSTTPVPAARVAALGPGVNVTRWFWYPPAETDAHFTGYLSDADLARLRAAGVRSVRLPVAPRRLFPTLDAERPAATRLAQYLAAVDRLVAAGLTVMVDVHPEQDAADFDADGPAVQALARCWGVLAARLATRDPERVVLELLNEPQFEGRAAAWAVVEDRLAGAVRRAAPRHTLVTSGAAWGGVDGLVARRPLADRNVVYSFHFYEPFPFTHQGATWVADPYPLLRGLPWPGTGTACLAAADAQSTPAARALAAGYCVDAWDAGTAARRIEQAAAWGRAHGVPVFVGEFGAYCLVTPPAQRLQWLRDVRAALDARGIPWTAWGWDDCFGVGATRAADGAWRPDGASAAALGFAAWPGG